MTVGRLDASPAAHDRISWLVAVFYVIFFFSGATSLVYQVAWVRLLSLFFGSDVYSATITLGVFMGGLALGSWLASLFADQRARPLVIYGLFEIAIGAAAFAVPTIIDLFETEYRTVYNAYVESAPWLYHAFRALVAASTLLVPTVLMGATLPLLVRFFVRRAGEIGERAGTFYAVNTLGALVGTLAAGFVLLPMLGVETTVTVAVTINLVIGVSAIAAGLIRPFAPAPAAPGLPADTDDLATAAPNAERRAVLIAIGLSGLAALALEVVWMRILVQSFSGTVYAFAIMLACFLFGIYYGSLKAAAAADHAAHPARTLARLLFGLALAVVLLALASRIAPRIFRDLTWTLTGISGGAFGVASVIAQFVIASLLILAPTIMLGATFPYAVKAFTAGLAQRAAGAGKVYAANTAGAIAGALIGGFILLPTIGARLSVLAVAAIFAAAGSVLLAAIGGDAARTVAGRPRFAAGALTAAVAAIVVALLPQNVIVNYGLQRSTRPTMLYHGEGTAHTVDIVRNEAGTTIMMVNGNVEADTSLVQRRHFVLKAYLPLLLHPDPEEVSVVGLGLGITLRSTARYPTVKRIRLIELSPDMVAAHQYLKAITGDILANPKVDLRIDDGRNFMAMSNETFDMITADPIHPRITGVGYLYTREYYQAIKARLRPGGIVTQWMPMYHISPHSFDVAFRTFVEVFPDATFWYVRGHGLFVAGAGPITIDCRNVIKMFAVPAVAEDFASIEIGTPFAFLGHLLMDGERIARYLARSRDRQINTDDNAYLEYRTPFEFLGRTKAIIPDLLRDAGWNAARTLRNCSEDEAAAIAAAFRARLARIPVELGEPLR